MNIDDLLHQQLHGLDEDLTSEIPVPHVNQVQSRGRKIRRNQIIVAGVAAVALLAVGTLGISQLGKSNLTGNDELEPAKAPHSSRSSVPSEPTRTSTQPSTIASTQPGTAPDIRTVDLLNARIKVGKISTCLAGTYTFANGHVTVKTDSSNPSTGQLELEFGDASPRPSVFADINHDGFDDVVLPIKCSIGYPTGSQVVVISSTPSGLKVIGATGTIASDTGTNINDIRVVNKATIQLKLEQNFPYRNSKIFTVNYGWNGHGLRQASRPKIDWENATMSLPALGKCAAAQVHFRNVVGRTNDDVWSIASNTEAFGPWYEQSPIGYSTVYVQCSRGGDIGTALVGVFATDSGPVVIGYLPRTGLVEGNEFVSATIDSSGIVHATIIVGDGTTMTKKYQINSEVNGFDLV